MLQHILLATSDRDLEDLVQSYLEGAEDGFDPTAVSNAKSFSKKLEADNWRNFHLLIVDNGIYPDRESRPPKNTNQGLHLLHDLKKRKVDLPSILLVDQVDGKLLTEVQRLENCELVIKKGVLDESIEAAIGRLQHLEQNKKGNGKYKRPDYEAMIEINISSEIKQDYHFRYRTSSGPIASTPKPLAVQWHVLENLCATSKALREVKENWEPVLQMIGKNLIVELQRSSDFYRDFTQIQGLDKDLQNLFIRFSLSRSTYGLACEALYDDERGFLMLKAPLTRKVDTRQYRDPLALYPQSDVEPINILFIEADVEGYVPSLKVAVEKLKNIRDEKLYFERIRDGKVDQAPHVEIGEIHLLSPEGSGADFKTTVKHYLMGKTGNEDLPKTFHVVHFAGHSVFNEDAKDDPGSLIFPGEKPEAVRIREFAQWLDAANTQLAYLSSCRSSDAEVAFELAQEGVPTVIGFRWDLEDDWAAEYAKAFYDGLLYDQPSLEQAFLAARQEMNARHVENRIWAAPTMIHQIQE